jgi:hypothetical protein
MGLFPCHFAYFIDMRLYALIRILEILFSFFSPGNIVYGQYQPQYLITLISYREHSYVIPKLAIICLRITHFITNSITFKYLAGISYKL